MHETPECIKSNALSVALIVPDARRRGSLVAALAGSQLTLAQELDAYPPVGDMPKIAHLDCQVIIVDLDSNTEQAIRVIESICSRNAAMTVMAYSSKNDATLMRRAMQAGAREFLIEPFHAETVSEAFARVFSRRPSSQKAAGKVLVFIPSKGGVGVTTIAANFAMVLTKESGGRVVVVDMDLQLGEIALGLGMTAAFSVVDALTNPTRLDRDFVSTLLIRHSSGLAVLASPEEYNFFHSPIDEGADKLFRILREEFDYIVVDTGTCHGHVQEALFEMADKLYLITEKTFPALRNSHRMISYLSGRDGSRKLEVVLNRFNSRHGDIDDNSATKALGRPINWKIPNAYAAARAAQDSGIPLAMENSPITRALVEMAKDACGKPSNIEKEKKESKGFSFFGSKAQSEPLEV